MAGSNSVARLSGGVLIATAPNQPAAPSAEGSSSELSSSSVASTGSARGNCSSDDGVVQINSSLLSTNRDSSHGSSTTGSS